MKVVSCCEEYEQYNATDGCFPDLMLFIFFHCTDRAWCSDMKVIAQIPIESSFCLTTPLEHIDLLITS